MRMVMAMVACVGIGLCAGVIASEGSPLWIGFASGCGAAFIWFAVANLIAATK